MRKSIRIRDQNPEHFFDVNYKDTTGDIDGVLEDIYKYIDMDFTGEAKAAISQWRQQNPRDKRAIHEYSMEQFGYTDEFIKEEFKEYRERYSFL